MQKELRSALTSHYLIAKLSLHRPLSCKGSNYFSLEALGSRILGWCGGGGCWQPLAFVCLRATTCAGIATANHRQPTHPHCLGARAHTGQRETSEWPGEGGPDPFLLSSPFLAASSPHVHLLACVALPQLMPTISLEAGLPQFLPSNALPPLTCVCRFSGSEGDLEVFQLGLYVPRGWEGWCEPPTPELLIWLQITSQTLNIS